jgi:hypothetical protein
MSDDKEHEWESQIIGNIIISIFTIVFFIAIISLFISYESNKEKIKQDAIEQKIFIEDDFDVKDSNYIVPPVIDEIKVK